MVRSVLLKLDNWLARLTELLLTIIGIPFFSMLMVEVLMRKLANHSLFGVYELAGYLATWISMMGAYLAYRNREMARLTFMVKKLPPLQRSRILLVNKLMVLVALFFLAISGVLFILNPAVLTQKSVSFNLPVIYSYAGIPVGLTLMAIQTLIQLFIRESNFLSEEGEALE